MGTIGTGRKIAIISCKEVPRYNGREGYIRHAENGKLWGSWGAIPIRLTDNFEYI